MKRYPVVAVIMLALLLVALLPVHAADSLLGAWYTVVGYGKTDAPWVETACLEINEDGTGSIAHKIWDMSTDTTTTESVDIAWCVEDDWLILTEQGQETPFSDAPYRLNEDTLFYMDLEFKRELVLPQEAGQVNAYANVVRITKPVSFEGKWYMTGYDMAYDVFEQHVEVDIYSDGSGYYASVNLPYPQSDVRQEGDQFPFTWHQDGDAFYINPDNTNATPAAVSLIDNCCWSDALGFLSRDPDAFLAIAIADNLELLEHPDPASRVLYRIAYQERVIVLGRVGNFVQVFTINTEGYYPTVGDPDFIRSESYGEGFIGFVDGRSLVLTEGQSALDVGALRDISAEYDASTTKTDAQAKQTKDSATAESSPAEPPSKTDTARATGYNIPAECISFHLNTDNTLMLTHVNLPDSLQGLLQKSHSAHYPIPQSLYGQKVTRLGDTFFMGECGIKEVTIPEGVVSLGQHAFALMNDLDKVYVPKSLVDIGLYAFGNDHPVTFYGPADSYTQQWVAMTKMRSAPDNERFEYVVMSKKDMRAHKKSLPPIRYAYEKGCKTIQQLVASGRSIEYVPESEPTDMHAQFLRPKGIDNPWLRLEFRYSTNEDGSIAINGYHYTSWYGAWLSDSGGMLTPYGDHVGYYSLEDTRQLDIPDTLNGHPVTEISYITTDHASILIPEGVTTIRRGIFQRGSPVIHVPASLTYIGPETGIDEEWDGMPMYFLGPDGSYTQQWLAALKQAEPKKYAKWRYLVDIRADLIAKGLTDDAISVYYYLLSHDTERLFSDFNFVATYVDDLKFWDVVFFASANWLEVIRSGAVSIGPALASADTGFIQLMADEFMNSEAKNKAILKMILDSMAGIEQDRLYSDMKLTTKKLKAAETLLEMVTGDDYWSTELLAVMTDPLQKTNKVMDTLLTDYQDSIDFLEALRGISGSNPKFQAAVNNMLVTYNMRFQNLYLNDKLDELFVKIVGKAVGSRPFGLVTTLLDMYQDSPAVKGLENVLAMNTIKHLALEEYRRLLGVIKSGQFEEKEIDHLLHVSDLCKGILLQEYKEMQKYYAIGSAQYKQLAKDILKIEQIMALDIMPIRMP